MLGNSMRNEKLDKWRKYQKAVDSLRGRTVVLFISAFLALALPLVLGDPFASTADAYQQHTGMFGDTTGDEMSEAESASFGNVIKAGFIDLATWVWMPIVFVWLGVNIRKAYRFLAQIRQDYYPGECRECGNGLRDEDDHFCPSCGYRVYTRYPHEG